MSSSVRKFLRFGSPVLLLLFLVALAFLSRSFFKEARRNMKLRSELKKLNAEVARLEGDSRTLADDLQAFQRPFAIEREARVKYGLRKEGERVLIIPDGSLEANVSEQNRPESQFSNVKAWWKYFTENSKS